MVPRLGHDHFLQNYFHFIIIHIWSQHTNYTFSILEASLNNIQKIWCILVPTRLRVIKTRNTKYECFPCSVWIRNRFFKIDVTTRLCIYSHIQVSLRSANFIRNSFQICSVFSSVQKRKKNCPQEHQYPPTNLCGVTNQETKMLTTTSVKTSTLIWRGWWWLSL